MNKIVSVLAMFVAVFGIASAQAQADKFPTKTIKIVVPAPAGGPGDTLARILGQYLTDAWKQPLIIENKPGGNNILATDMVAKAPPDGYTLLMTVDYAMTVNPHTQKSLPYDPLKDFAHITTLADSLLVLVVNSALPVDSMKDLVKYASTRPEGLTVATGTLTGRLMVEQLAAATKMKLVIVPYKGSADVFAAIMGGHVDMAFAGYTPFKEHVNKGKFKVLAGTGAERSPATPNTPTFRELGYSGFDTGVWLGLAAPAGTPAPIVKKLNDELNKALVNPEIVAKFDNLGLVPMISNPLQAVELIRRDSDRWGKIIKERGIRAD